MSQNGNCHVICITSRWQGSRSTSPSGPWPSHRSCHQSQRMRPGNRGQISRARGSAPVLGDVPEGVQGGEALLDRIGRASGLAVRISDAHGVGGSILYGLDAVLEMERTWLSRDRWTSSPWQLGREGFLAGGRGRGAFEARRRRVCLSPFCCLRHPPLTAKSQHRLRFALFLSTTSYIIPAQTNHKVRLADGLPFL